jgi:RNA polymerase sigma-70 factor (ECF subfamily)
MGIGPIVRQIVRGRGRRGNFSVRLREYDVDARRRPVDDDPMRATLTDATAASDAALAARLACRDATALDALYRRHRSAVYRFALLWTGQPAVAADVTQDVFLHLLMHADDFDPSRGALLPWLLGIARNLARRRTGAQRDDEPLPEDVECPAALASPETSSMLRQDVEALRGAIAALPPHYRDVVVLVELAERSYAETAAICGCELNTVRSRLFRGRALLARWLALAADDGSTVARKVVR